VKKKALAAAFMLILLFSAVVGAYFINLGEANPIAEMEWKTPPIISIHSPMNNNTFSVNNVPLNFTVTKPTDWLIHGGYEAQQILRSVSYQLDGKYYDPIPANSKLESPFDYSANLTNLGDGVHNLKVYAYATGWVIEMHGLWEYEVPINSSSDVVYFTVDATPPTILILSVENKTYDTSNIPLNFTVSESVSQITYSLDGEENITITGNTTLSGLANGDHNLTVYAKDKAGTVGTSETTYFSVDAPFPTTLVIAPIVSVVVIDLGLLVYFKKRNHARTSKHGEIEQSST
jgi:hypothetical protein